MSKEWPNATRRGVAEATARGSFYTPAAVPAGATKSYAVRKGVTDTPPTGDESRTGRSIPGRALVGSVPPDNYVPVQPARHRKRVLGEHWARARGRHERALAGVEALVEELPVVSKDATQHAVLSCSRSREPGQLVLRRPRHGVDLGDRARRDGAASRKLRGVARGGHGNGGDRAGRGRDRRREAPVAGAVRGHRSRAHVGRALAVTGGVAGRTRVEVDVERRRG